MPKNKKTAKTPQWFCIATAGTTADGRKIAPQWLEQAAANYDPKLYQARINLEHIKFDFMADSPHSKAWGDVLALKCEKVNGVTKLYAQLDPTEELKALIAQRQKIFTSVELNLEFAHTGEAYLVGLAVTDRPASLGTEPLKFTFNQPMELITMTLETEMKTEMQTEEKDQSPTLLEKFRAMFAVQETAKTDVEATVLELAALVKTQGETIQALTANVESLKAELATFKTQEKATAENLEKFRQQVESLRQQETPASEPAVTGESVDNDLIY